VGTCGPRTITKRNDEHAATNKQPEHATVRTVKLTNDAEGAANASDERNGNTKPAPFADERSNYRGNDARSDITDWNLDSLDSAM